MDDPLEVVELSESAWLVPKEEDGGELELGEVSEVGDDVRVGSSEEVMVRIWIGERVAKGGDSRGRIGGVL